MYSKEKEKVLDELSAALDKIKEYMPVSFIPEVGMNIVYAVPSARVPSDVAGIEGRIVKKGDAVYPVGPIRFGASDHISRIVLTAMKFDPEIRSAANIRFSEETINKFRELPFEVRNFERDNEPPGVDTMDWGVAFCCEEGDVADVIYDRGGMGKEPMIRILGEDPGVVANNIIMISKRINNKTNR